MSIVEITDTLFLVVTLRNQTTESKRLEKKYKSQPKLNNNYRRGAWNNKQNKNRNSSCNNRAQKPNFFFNNQNSYKYGNRFNNNRQIDKRFPRHINQNLTKHEMKTVFIGSNKEKIMLIIVMLSQIYLLYTNEVSKNKNSTSNPKARIFLNLYCFATGDNKKQSGLELKFMIDQGSTCTIINYLKFNEINR